MGAIQRWEYFEALKNVPQIFNAIERCLEEEEATYKTVLKYMIVTLPRKPVQGSTRKDRMSYNNPLFFFF